MAPPDLSVGRGQRPAKIEFPIAGITPDGRLLDAEGHEVSIDDVMSQPGMIKLGPPPDSGTLGVELGGEVPQEEPDGEGDRDETAEDDPNGGRDE